jgi:hypothetical protein
MSQSPELAYKYAEDLPASKWIIADEYHDVQYMFPRSAELDVQSATRIGLISSMRAIFVPIAATLALAGGAPGVDIRRRCRYQVSSATQLTDYKWHLDEQTWVPAPELITNEQVRTLNELLALPFTSRDVSHILADE